MTTQWKNFEPPWKTLATLTKMISTIVLFKILPVFKKCKIIKKLEVNKKYFLRVEMSLWSFYLKLVSWTQNTPTSYSVYNSQNTQKQNCQLRAKTLMFYKTHRPQISHNTKYKTLTKLYIKLELLKSDTFKHHNSTPEGNFFGKLIMKSWTKNEQLILRWMKDEK